MRTRLRCAVPLLAVAVAQLFLLAQGAMLGCSFSAPVGSVDDAMDDPNFYACGCQCSTTVSQSVRVRAALDDAEQTLRADDTDGAGDLDLGVVLAGVRFADVTIPPGAVVTAAAIQFTSDQGFAGDNTTPLNLDVYAVASPNAPAFGGDFTNLAVLTRTGASTGWQVPPWQLQQAGPAQRTPDLSAIVQEVIGTPGWQAGNALAVIFAGSGGRREAESYNGNPARAALLEVTYTVATDQAFDVCMPPDLNPNVLDNPIPTDQQLQADCQGRVQTTLTDLAMQCQYPAQCTCGLVADSRRFNAACNDPCAEVPLDADCSNFDPTNTPPSATNTAGTVPVCVAARRASGGAGPVGLAAAAFGQLSECAVEGPATIEVGDEMKSTDAAGTIGFIGRPCPGGQCAVGVAYDLGLDPITFEVRFHSDPTFEDLASSGASTADAALIGPSGFGMLGAQATESSLRGRRDSDTRAYVLTNPDPVGLFVDWEAHTCALFGNVAGTVDGETQGDEALVAELSVSGPILNEPPRAAAGDDQAIECTSPQGAVVLLDGRGSGDPEDNLALLSWTRDSRVGMAVGAGATVEVQQALGGDTTYVLRAIDAFGQTDEDASLVRVVDTTAPDLSLMPSPALLWPPSHQLVPVHVTIAAADTCDDAPSIRLVSIASNEGDLANGSGHTSPDIAGAQFGTDDRDFELRAERAGGGSGRVYTITYEVADASGNVTRRTATVFVPKSQS